MKNVLYLICIGILFCSCINKTITGNGNVTSQKRSVTGFKAIRISGAYNIVLQKTDNESVTIVTDDNLQSIIKTEVKDSTLEISNKITIFRSKEMKILIGCPKLSNIDFSGAADLRCDSMLKINNLYVTISGAGKVNLAVDANQLGCAVSGGADLIYTGKANKLSVTIAGAGNIEATELLTKCADIEISGYGKAKLNVSDTLNIVISGYGNVSYKGNPFIKQSISGAGSVEKLQ